MNLLKHETSPYLLQHQSNPVWWMPWGDEAFSKAQKEGKLIFLSIGYSTCHWCHVMEKECFEDENVADALNSNFVSIKVDREERPDVDSVYMEALQTLSGSGGWPLSAWLTPDAKPFYAGTYFPKMRFLPMILQIQQIWTDQKEKIVEDSDKLISVMKQNLNRNLENSNCDWQKIVKHYSDSCQQSFDSHHGGFGSAPKFPQSMSLLGLLQVERILPNQSCLNIVDKTLNEMGRGGLFDHLRGGFHRYSVDESWMISHFEKMLYDNALLALTFLKRGAISNNKEYLFIAGKTLDYVLREMTADQGGFFAAQDADSLNPETNKKQEGYFCSFSFKEVSAILSEKELKSLQASFGLSETGQFEGRNILHRQVGVNLDIYRQDEILGAFDKLDSIRKSKPQPHRDEKIITAWNCWMISAFVSASKVLGDEKYKKAALKAGEFLKKHLLKDNIVLRSYCSGQANIGGVSDDYAAFIGASLDLFEVTNDPDWYDLAKTLQASMDQQFWDSAAAGYFRDNNSDVHLILRLKEDYDGVRPNANSMAAMNLLKFYQLTGDAIYRDQLQKLFQQFEVKLLAAPLSLPALFEAYCLFHSPVKQMVIVLPDDDELSLEPELIKEFEKHSIQYFVIKESSVFPNEITLFQSKSCLDAQRTFYLCQEGACQQPVTQLDLLSLPGL